MEKEADKNHPQTTATENEKDKSGGNKKYNFYRKPSIKKKPPEVKQTLTSYKRMLKANPLLKYEMEGKDLSLLSKQLPSFSTSRNGNPSEKFQFEKQSLPFNFNPGKFSVSNTQKSLKNPTKPISKSSTKVGASILSENKPKPVISTNSINISKQSSVDFSTSTSRLFTSTKLENRSNIQTKKEAVVKSNSKTKFISKISKPNSTRQVNSTSSNGNPEVGRGRERKIKPIRRSLSAQHFDRKKGTECKIEQQKPFTKVELTHSLDDVSMLKPTFLQHNISPIAEGSRESSIVFKTPFFNKRRSVSQCTPRSTSRRSLYRRHSSTALPSLNDLQKRLNDWLMKRGKSVTAFHHLKCFGIEAVDKMDKVVDEENKENVEVDEQINSSSEDLKIIIREAGGDDGNAESEKLLALNEKNSEHIAKDALEDLQKLIQEGYPTHHCEAWLELIREKYPRLEEEPQYWECRAAIEQSRGNISSAVDCYKTAIVQGAEIQAVDESLDILLQKFSLLNISVDKVESEKSIRERARIVQDARNVFKSSIIQFAVQERKLKKNSKEENKIKLVATPVRRSTRLSRTAYTSTPGVKIHSSLQELDVSAREIIDFKKNNAFF